jgi:hypothetical protein
MYSPEHFAPVELTIALPKIAIIDVSLRSTSKGRDPQQAWFDRQPVISAIGLCYRQNHVRHCRGRTNPIFQALCYLKDVRVVKLVAWGSSDSYVSGGTEVRYLLSVDLGGLG